MTEINPELTIKHEGKQYYFKWSKPEQVKQLQEYLEQPLMKKLAFSQRGKHLYSSHKELRRLKTVFKKHVFKGKSSSDDVILVRLSDRTVKVKQFSL